MTHEGPVDESRIELESNKDKESWEREVRRLSEGGCPVGILELQLRLFAQGQTA